MDRMRRQARVTSVARGAVAAAVATFVALLSHVTAGGEMPGWVGIAVPLALSFVACSALAGRRLSLWRLSLAVVVSQVLFHTLFVLGSFDAAAGHVHGAATVSTGPVVASGPMDAAMLLGHAVAAAVTALALHRGERTFALLRVLAVRAVAWLRARVRVTLPFGPAPARRVLADVVAPLRPVAVLLADTADRRGPPALAH